MNTTIMAILNPGSAKAGNGVSALKHKASNGQGDDSDIIAPLRTADKSSRGKAKTVSKDHEANFNDALRKKIEAERSRRHDITHKEEKDVKTEPSDVNLQDAPIAPYVVPGQPETGAVDTEISKNTDPEENAVKLLEATPTEDLADDNQKATTMPATSKDAIAVSDGLSANAPVDSVDATGIDSDEVAAIGDRTTDARQMAPENRQIPTESTQTVLGKHTEQAEATSQPTVNRDGKTASNVEQNIPVNKPVVPEQPEVTAKNDKFEVINNQNTASNERISPVTEKSSQQNASPRGDEQPKNTAQTPASSQAAVSSPNSTIQTENIAAQATVHKMNVATEQINTLEAEKQHHSVENKEFNDNLNIDESVSAETAGTSTAGEIRSGIAETPKMPAAANSGLTVGRQIQESITSSYKPGTQEMVIRLDPPDLGRVTIRFVEQQDGITGVLHVEKSQTKHDIQQALPEIIQSLQNADVNIKKIEVVLNHQPNYQSGEQPTGQNSHTGQQNTPGQHSFGNSTSYREWLANSNTGNNTSGSHIELTDKSINMLI